MTKRHKGSRGEKGRLRDRTETELLSRPGQEESRSGSHPPGPATFAITQQHLVTRRARQTINHVEATASERVAPPGAAAPQPRPPRARLAGHHTQAPPQQGDVDRAVQQRVGDTVSVTQPPLHTHRHALRAGHLPHHTQGYARGPDREPPHGRSRRPRGLQRPRVGPSTAGHFSGLTHPPSAGRCFLRRLTGVVPATQRPQRLGPVVVRVEAVIHLGRLLEARETCVVPDPLTQVSVPQQDAGTDARPVARELGAAGAGGPATAQERPPTVSSGHPRTEQGGRGLLGMGDHLLTEGA